MGQPSLTRTITPGYATALLSSPQLLAGLCRQYFRKYDANRNGLMEVQELLQLTLELRNSLGVPLVASEAEVRASMVGYARADIDALGPDEFLGWFSRELSQDLASVKGGMAATYDKLSAMAGWGGDAPVALR